MQFIQRGVVPAVGTVGPVGVYLQFDAVLYVCTVNKVNSQEYRQEGGGLVRQEQYSSTLTWPLSRE